MPYAWDCSRCKTSLISPIGICKEPEVKPSYCVRSTTIRAWSKLCWMERRSTIASSLEDMEEMDTPMSFPQTSMEKRHIIPAHTRDRPCRYRHFQWFRTCIMISLVYLWVCHPQNPPKRLAELRPSTAHHLHLRNIAAATGRKSTSSRKFPGLSLPNPGAKIQIM